MIMADDDLNSHENLTQGFFASLLGIAPIQWQDELWYCNSTYRHNTAE